ncbi:MAG: carbohydrate-binding family 9-like protein [Armatimonadota bacterium]
MSYLIRRTAEHPSLQGEWDSAIWQSAETGALTHFVRQEVSDHRPRVQFRMLYDNDGLYLIFRVEDRYVRSVVTELNGSVCRDSCTEFFVRPKPEHGYFNFEVNCGGAMLCYYIEDPTVVQGVGFTKSQPLTMEDAALVQIYHSMPAVVDPEITEPTIWFNEIHISRVLLEKYVGPLGELAGQEWQANLYKCADATSHPHWATWSPIQGASFHQPQYFAPLSFEK